MKPKKVPMRMCIGCRTMKPKRELVRLVRDAQDCIRVDFTGKLPGRGAYICRDVACVDKAIKIRAVGHALGQNLTAEQEKSIREALQADE